MKQSIFHTVALALLLCLPGPGWSGGDREAQLKEEAEDIVRQFAGTLKPQLIQAMQKGGPVQAINVCSQVAPQIAQQLSKSTGWQVRRVSLKPRNTDTATPDDWEKHMLETFDRRRAAGEDIANLTATALNPEEFRFMRAQGTQPLCLNCHAENLSPEVKRALQQHYPNDSATGYREGQVRGAFSLTRPL